MPDYSKQLSKYIPEQAAPIISQWINDTGCRFKVTRSRSSKLGDYRAPFRGQTHQITVNHDLNPFAFLITTIHEFAHLKTWNEFKNGVKPHGVEWKRNFKLLIEPFIRLQIFPSDILKAVTTYMDNPAASSCTDLHLYRTLKNYDTKDSSAQHVEDLENNSVFCLKNGRSFQKLEKIRKRYKCIALDSQKIYLFHPLAEVFPEQD
ncbi:SprT family zinc-dependent metalloprotease [Parapusillimonas sp. SGNA-6]|uniref:SprT family zinc-dependent metalloprotease n=1 Tax=Parapedobacter sp. SGR-10 TaxID=2710879 RepID=UPI0013D301C2|nr:SprT family zinc-dependent metalloprotease [Parapedobacter sp. SGR-10]NGF55075.1 SprT family zinc-dependent metalloprotease [Parapedobacter sp. SGR-10]NGM89895.1 SprT family zinc-dependent metalloprotease [Parapusillimonas sp. SGNA-6]